MTKLWITCLTCSILGSISVTIGYGFTLSESTRTPDAWIRACTYSALTGLGGGLVTGLALATLGTTQRRRLTPEEFKEEAKYQLTVSDWDSETFLKLADLSGRIQADRLTADQKTK
jgi:hypothetical protein